MKCQKRRTKSREARTSLHLHLYSGKLNIIIALGKTFPEAIYGKEILVHSCQGRLIIRSAFLLHVAICMPVVELTVWSGITLENKKRVVEGITRILEEIGIPRDATTVIIREEPKDNWATGGKIHSELFTNRGRQP
jgi:4-oxalocrotonate tautomerase